MSVILAGPNNKIMMAAPGQPMLVRPLGSDGGGPPDPPPVTPPDWSSVTGLIGWWDAGAVSGVRGPGGAALTAFGAPAGAVADKSGVGTTLTVWHKATSGTSPPVATGHLSGVMGGIGRNIVVPPQVPQNGQQLPVMDPDQGLISAALGLGASTPWTVLLVWSRPNWRQSNTGPSTLLSIAGTQVLAADNSAGTNRLVLFPGGGQSVLTSALTRRHTHAVILCNRPGAGVDVWLDGVQTATAASNPLGSSVSAPQMQREAMASIAADPTQNVAVVLPQTADSLPRAASYDSTTGIWTGGDSLHRDLVDNQRFGRLAAPLVARAVLASGGGDSVQSIPVGVPSLGGPVVTHVYRESGTSLIVTVQHDGGDDLIVPATQAAIGAGWAVTDGGSVASPGAVVTATACVQLNATQLRITLARSLVNASAACRLFYPYGTATIGRGNVVTDNLSLVTPRPGWDIAADLGPQWALNMPVHVPMVAASGVVLSDAP